MYQTFLECRTTGRGAYDITAAVQEKLSPVAKGLCHLFLQHTSASLILCENTDPRVLTDLETFTTRWVPDGDSIYTHTSEGPDDMPAHIRSVFANNTLTIPIREKSLALGTWQGIFLWEHRVAPHQRTIVLSCFE